MRGREEELPMQGSPSQDHTWAGKSGGSRPLGKGPRWRWVMSVSAATQDTLEPELKQDCSESQAVMSLQGMF